MGTGKPSGFIPRSIPQSPQWDGHGQKGHDKTPASKNRARLPTAVPPVPRRLPSSPGEALSSPGSPCPNLSPSAEKACLHPGKTPREGGKGAYNPRRKTSAERMRASADDLSNPRPAGQAGKTALTPMPLKEVVFLQKFFAPLLQNANECVMISQEHMFKSLCFPSLPAQEGRRSGPVGCLVNGLAKLPDKR